MGRVLHAQAVRPALRRSPLSPKGRWREESYNRQSKRSMINITKSFLLRLSILLSCLLSGVLLSISHAQSPKPEQDSGISGLQQSFRKLRTTARLMHVTAHPDDEDGGMLALQSRGVGASVMLMTLNRGEGGQNKTGPELFDALGILRSLELLAADEYYGVEQRFSRVVDFGFSKNAAETLNKWGGKEVALADVVRAIRVFRPDVLVSRFQGAPRDGHGNHQAAGLIARDAFKAAGDPNRFPEQIREGLLPWQPKKLYVGNIRPNEEHTLRLDSGAYDPVLGRSYSQLAVEGLSRQMSQGAGGAYVPPGHRYSHYKLVESITDTPALKGGKEQSFFDGIDTTLNGLAGRFSDELSRVQFLKSGLGELDAAVSEAMDRFSIQDPSSSAAALLRGLEIVTGLISKLEAAPVSLPAKTELQTHLRPKRDQLEEASNLSLGVTLEAVVDAAAAGESQEPVSLPSNQQTFLMAVPGQTFTLTARLYNRSKQDVKPVEVELEAPAGWQTATLKKALKSLGKDDGAEVQFTVTVPRDAAYTRPYWHRKDQQADAVHTIDSPNYATLPLPPHPLRVRATYSLGAATGRVESVVQVKYVDPVYGQKHRPLAVGPPLSLELQPPNRVISVDNRGTSQISVGVRNNVTAHVDATVRLEAPGGWRVEPAFHQASFTRDGEFNSFQFKVTPVGVGEGRYEISAVLDYEGKSYREGYTVATRNDLDTFYYYRPAHQQVSAISIKMPPRLKVGYVMGAGDDIPDALKEIGLDVEVVAEKELAMGNLNRFDTIVLGIRAYDVRSDVRDNNKRLLDFVERGGTLVVQYNQSVGTFNSSKFTPFPATASNERVTVEEAPVEILAPEDPVFNFPNKITARDFDGWVQERGVYFMNKWDDRYKPLLASNDPGEKPLKGGLLKTAHGKGTYIFTGYAFFRQIPAGVPGAVRLFVNLLSGSRYRER